ncbi:MAG TPA: inner membrane CreD family protein [Anaerolineales bacterium]|nr:inner membrane CreD family protein [Anaerolineales bacterium]
MTVPRLIGIIFIFVCTTVAWGILGASIMVRTNSGYALLNQQVEDLWGSEHYQRAPTVTLKTIQKDGDKEQEVITPVELESSNIQVDLKLQHRRKGLLWYSTYDVDFAADYIFKNPLDERAEATATFNFPASGTIYDGFVFRVDTMDITPNADESYEGIKAMIGVPPGGEILIHIAYKSRGLDRWVYSFSDGITTVKNFSLKAVTDFTEYDFPPQSISPSTKTPTKNGWTLEWTFNNLVSDFDIGVQMPNKLNPGPLASRMSYFAPVSLLFFFTTLIVLGAVSDRNLHPMHYFFLGTSFFSFHVLFAYLVDHILLEVAFIIAALVSMALVATYLYRAAGGRFALWVSGAQLVFLVLFSYAFFFEGYTGLVITIGAILTLAIMMQLTARVDWNEVFRKKEPKSQTAK